MNLDHAQCYRAVESRDARFDGRFFSGVKTTGVYCRPICPAKTPKSENIEFYPSAAAAEEAGFRPCRRCRPETSPGTPEWLGASAVVSRALQIITEALIEHEDLKIPDVASRLGLSDRQLRRLFEEHLGASPVKIAQTQRVHFAKMLVEGTPLPVTEIAFTSGFSSIRRFNNLFRSTYGAAPSHFRNGAAKRKERPEHMLRLKLPYRPPFDWGQFVEFFSLRAIPGVEVVENGIYKRTIRVGETAGVIEVGDIEGEHALWLRVPMALSKALYPISERVRRMFDLKADPDAVATHLQRDEALRPLVNKRPGLRVPGAWNPFELGIRAILGQQVTVKAATTLCGRLAEAIGLRIENAVDERLSYLFPGAGDLIDVDVRIGTPESRMNSVRALARAVASGDLALKIERDLESFQKRFCELPGIGPWTAHYFAMRALGEPDAFPDGDVALQKAMRLALGRKLTQRKMIERAESWRPWRAYATLHLWASLADHQQEES